MSPHLVPAKSTLACSVIGCLKTLGLKPAPVVPTFEEARRRSPSATEVTVYYDPGDVMAPAGLRALMLGAGRNSGGNSEMRINSCLETFAAFGGLDLFLRWSPDFWCPSGTALRHMKPAAIIGSEFQKSRK
jgi:hypothetical protein